MSDPRDMSDPMDKAYAEAEAVLSDEAARAARRARVLAAVAAEPVAPPAQSTPPAARPAWRSGGWLTLAAASVAGLSVLVATRVYPPTPIRQPTPPAPPAAPASAVAEAPQPTPTPPPAPTPASRSAEPSRRESAAASPPTPLPPPALPVTRQPAPPPPPAAAPSSSVIEEIVITGSRVAAPSAEAKAQRDQAARLRAAAAAGRNAEVAALLAKGVPIDAQDAEGETALMKSVQADRPATAALLRLRGASPDLTNNAGVSAMDMARAIDDPKLDRALSREP